jgi:hypothetical protein
VNVKFTKKCTLNYSKIEVKVAVGSQHVQFVHMPKEVVIITTLPAFIFSTCIFDRFEITLFFNFIVLLLGFMLAFFNYFFDFVEVF